MPWYIIGFSEVTEVLWYLWDDALDALWVCGDQCHLLRCGMLGQQTESNKHQTDSTNWSTKPSNVVGVELDFLMVVLERRMLSRFAYHITSQEIIPTCGHQSLQLHPVTQFFLFYIVFLRNNYSHCTCDMRHREQRKAAKWYQRLSYTLQSHFYFWGWPTVSEEGSHVERSSKYNTHTDFPDKDFIPPLCLYTADCWLLMF